MDKVLLGMLMLKRLTIYEIRNIIKQNFQAMCSDSLGSIQATIKKLMASNMITCEEFVEKSVNKKVYSITEYGRKTLVNWLKIPIDMGKSKNMELSKLLFMGMVPVGERQAIIKAVILNLNNELENLEKIQIAISNTDENIRKFLLNLESDSEYLHGLQDATMNLDAKENVKGIASFENMTLQFSIDTTKFYITSFESLWDKMEKGEI